MITTLIYYYFKKNFNLKDKKFFANTFLNKMTGIYNDLIEGGFTYTNKMKYFFP